MQDMGELYSSLSQLSSDVDVALALRKYFSKFGKIMSVFRFKQLENEGKRCFLIRFENRSDAGSAARKSGLRSFAFDGVLIELGKQKEAADKPVADENAPPGFIHTAKTTEHPD